jgi:hypothetical protein
VVYDDEHAARKSNDNDLPGAQLESIHTNGECVNKLIENLVDIALKLSDEIRALRKDKGSLNFKLDHVSVPGCHCRASPTPRTSTSSAPEPRRIESYRDYL